MLLSLLGSGLHLDPLTLIITLVIILASLALVLSVHEAAHAFVANALGDPTARLSGRLTLNPLAHLDPIGTIGILFFGFGWGKPVPFNPYNLKNPRRDAALTLRLGSGQVGVTGMVISQLVVLNLTLAVFNLIPLGPLDGFKVVAGLLPWQLAIDWQQTERWGIFILLFLMMTPVFGTIVGVPVSVLSRLLLGV
ncbi:MAG: site-2 protease family protein [candidate division WWE3 bacterium]|nr:site-2 protease family protein [candidate division WWE3 bacterium]